MIGDRVDTDIAFGKNSGIDTLLVLSGCCTTPSDEADFLLKQLDYNYFQKISLI